MSDKEILKNNKLIAEFMGVELPLSVNNFAALITQYNGYYHKSWDWLMPVIEKISSLYYRVVLEFDKNPELNDIYIQNTITAEYLQTDYYEDRDYQPKSNIELIWFNVVNFIKWYNKNK